MCTYFPNGSLASLTDVSGKPVHFEYDWRGKLSGVKDENGNTLAQYTHTPGGRLKEIRHGNGMHTQYEYDTDGNIIHFRLERPDGTALTDWQYEYDLNGNRTLKAGSYADAEDRLCGTVIRYRYDKMDRLTEESYDGEAVRYSYDPCGNRLEKVDKNGKEVYTYSVKNQLISRKSERTETFYRYDQQGNVLEATGTEGGTYYSYNAFNQQTKVRKFDGSYLESQYDAEYLRAGTLENGKVSGFVYYNGELLTELDQNQEATGRYIPGYGVAGGWNRKNEGYYFYHLDEQLSTAYITGAEGQTENRYQYDAFGAARDCQENFPNRIRYTGQQYDPITEQYYLRARYYNPVVGRFLQEDVNRTDGLNLYVYCTNNPVIYYDSDGNKKKRIQYLGKTPGINSKTGREVLLAAFNSGKLDISALDKADIEAIYNNNSFRNINLTSSVREKIKFVAPDGTVHSLKEAQMAHKNTGFNSKGKPYMDAVAAWNTDLKQYGARSDQARKFMLNSDNYELDYGSRNMSEGAKLKMTYDDPYTPLRNVEDVYPDREELQAKQNNEGICKEE